jgi:hypothetical protein
MPAPSAGARPPPPEPGARRCRRARPSDHASRPVCQGAGVATLSAQAAALMPRSTVATAATTRTARRSSGRGRPAWSMAGSARSTARPPAAEHAWAPATCRGVPALSLRRTFLPCRDSAVMTRHALRREDPQPFRSELDPEPEPPASAAPVVCFRCRGSETGCLSATAGGRPAGRASRCVGGRGGGADRLVVRPIGGPVDRGPQVPWPRRLPGPVSTSGAG